MKLIKELAGEEYSVLLVLIGLIVTGLVGMFSLGISGNDFWWHVKAGEWMVTNISLPSIDTFSWFMQENGVKWVSHEWLSQIVLYILHYLTGDLGMVFISLLAGITMMLMIVISNRKAIAANILIATAFLIPMTILVKNMFYGRPHLISFFLLYATLSCLYAFRQNAKSRSIFLVPLIAVLWSNFHGGSSTLPYILCFIFFVSGIFDFSSGKLHGERLSNRQLGVYLIMGLLSIAAVAVNPYGLHMLAYPYINMADAFQQEVINEWFAPDAKKVFHLILFYMPFFIVAVSLIISDKKIRFVDLLVFLFFSNMFFRSVRFAIVFNIAASFFVFDYLNGDALVFTRPRRDKYAFGIIMFLFVVINVFSFFNMTRTARDGSLISVALEQKFVDFIKADAPKRLYNNYNYGVTLIYNEIQTFVDARADLFSPHNLRDSHSLENLRADSKAESKKFDPEAMINKYDFDAFLTSLRSPLSVYLMSKPDEYIVLLEDEDTVYFRSKRMLTKSEKR